MFLHWTASAQEQGARLTAMRCRRLYSLKKWDITDKLWALRDGHDFIAGRRTGRKQPFSRKCVTLFSRLSVRMFYGKSISDVNTPYRLMHHEMLREMLNCIPPDTFAPNVIISGLAAKQNRRFCEVPITYTERTTGEVSIKKFKLLKAAVISFLQVFFCALKLECSRHKKPLLCGILLVISLAFFSRHCLYAFYSPTVKNWNEMTGGWHQKSPGVKANRVRSNAAFFKGVYMRSHQKRAIGCILETTRKFKDKKIFFGPELEMFYPAAGRFPPKDGPCGAILIILSGKKIFRT